MKRQLLFLVTGFLLISCASYPTPGTATEPSVLIMGEDWDEDTVPRKSQAFERVIQAISSQLRQEGFRVKDETAITEGAFIQGRVRRTKAELFRIAKASRNPMIDAVITFKIYPQIETTAEAAWINALVTGNLLNVATGDHIGDFEATFPENLPTSKSCVAKRDCAIKVIGDRSRMLGQEVGVVLATQLRRATITQSASTTGTVTGQSDATMLRSYTLTFDNFKTSEINRAEELLAAFSGYQRHEVGVTTLRHAEMTYETRSEDAKLKRNLRQMVEYMGIDGSVKCVNRTCSISKF